MKSLNCFIILGFSRAKGCIAQLSGTWLTLIQGNYIDYK
jgi:hypothetical protein